MQRFLGGCDRCVQCPEFIPAGSDGIWLLVASWVASPWCLAGRAMTPFGEDIELVMVGCAIPGRTSWVGLCTWSWQGRSWPRLPELLNDARGGDHNNMGCWCPKGPYPTGGLLLLLRYEGGSRKLPVLDYTPQLCPWSQGTRMQSNCYIKGMVL